MAQKGYSDKDALAILRR